MSFGNSSARGRDCKNIPGVGNPLTPLIPIPGDGYVGMHSYT